MRIYGAVGEFSTPEDLVDAARAMRQDGFTKMDACTPFPVHGIDDAIGIKQSPLGWLVMVAIRPLWLQMSLPGLLWLAAGGLAYTAGVGFYATDERVKYGHFIWHLFVLTGTCCHFFAVMTSV